MGDKKKSKALALELMDDLLNEDSSIEVEAMRTDPGSKEPVSDNTERVADLSLEKPYSEKPFQEKSSHLPDKTHADNDRTEISDPSFTQHVAANAAPKAKSNQRPTEDKVRANVGRFAPLRSSGPASTTDVALAQSESLRIAQSRLLEFEQEIERLRLQNEELAAAGETLRRRTDELGAVNQKLESDYDNLESTFKQEKDILLGSKEALQRDLSVARQKSEELELRISSNLQKIRVRERELENRLELVKMESAALIRSKDEMILELKRNIDQLNLELNNYRTKNQELNRQTTDKQEQLRRTVKALRLALSMLEGEEEGPRQGATAPTPLKKVK